MAHLEVLGALLLLLAIAAQPESQRALERALELWGDVRRYAETYELTLDRPRTNERIRRGAAQGRAA